MTDMKKGDQETLPVLLTNKSVVTGCHGRVGSGCQYQAIVYRFSTAFV